MTLVSENIRQCANFRGGPSGRGRQTIVRLALLTTAVFIDLVATSSETLEIRPTLYVGL